MYLPSILLVENGPLDYKKEVLPIIAVFKDIRKGWMLVRMLDALYYRLQGVTLAITRVHAIGARELSLRASLNVRVYLLGGHGL